MGRTTMQPFCIEVRSAQSSDLPFLAWAMQESMLPGVGRGIFDLALAGTGVTPLAFHEVLLRTGASNWGQVEDFLIVHDGAGRHLAAAAAYRPNPLELRPLTAQGFRLACDVLDWPAARARQFWRHYATVFGLFGNAPQLHQPASYVIEYVAVVPEERGRGLVRLLLDAHAARARTEGSASLGISVMTGNKSALRAYHKYGFEPCRTLVAEDFGGAFPGITRLMLRLDPAAHSEKREDALYGADI